MYIHCLCPFIHNILTTSLCTEILVGQMESEDRETCRCIKRLVLKHQQNRTSIASTASSRRLIIQSDSVFNMPILMWIMSELKPYCFTGNTFMFVQIYLWFVFRNNLLSVFSATHGLKWVLKGYTGHKGTLQTDRKRRWQMIWHTYSR